MVTKDLFVCFSFGLVGGERFCGVFFVVVDIRPHCVGQVSLELTIILAQLSE